MLRKTNKKPGANPPRELKAPIYVESLGLWMGSLTRADIGRQVFQQGAEKLAALMTHYKISRRSPDKWEQLSWCLAEELGLMEVTLRRPKKPHASRVWSDQEKLLVNRFDQKIDERRQRRLSVSKRNIADHLRNRYPEYKHLSAKSLVNRYHEAKGRMSEGGLAQPCSGRVAAIIHRLAKAPTGGARETSGS